MAERGIMAEISIEKVKSHEPIFKEVTTEKQRDFFRDSRMNMLNTSENKQAVSPDLGQEIEDSFKEEKDIRKRGKKSPSNGPKHVALERRFSYERTDDDMGMRDVRRKLKYYFKSIDEQGTKQQSDNLRRIIKECDAYCKGKFMIFKRGRARERLKEVKALKKEAEDKLRTMPIVNSTGKVELIHNSPVSEYLTTGQSVVVVGRFIVENLLRIPLTILTLPVWAVNEKIRKRQKKKGQVQNRSIRLPWMHRWGYYVTQAQFKKKTIGFSNYCSFQERFIKHNTDFEAMKRAEQDLYSTSDEGFDYRDDEEDDALED